MKKFELIDVKNQNKLRKFSNKSTWEKCILLPYYSDAYICFSRTNVNLAFEHLINL